MGRTIIIGPDGDNECCHCGFDVGDAGCPPGCSTVNASLYGSTPGEHGVPCFPQTCCPCPDMSEGRQVTLTLSAVNCGLNETIILNKNDGISLCQANPRVGNSPNYCYAYDADPIAAAKGAAIVYEKYGKIGHVFAGDEECAGSKADISLCCCDGVFAGSIIPVGDAADCHMCNYFLSIQFISLVPPGHVDWPKYCDCPVETFPPLPVDYPLLPGQDQVENDDVFNAFVLINSICDPLYLEFESANNLYWNCGPCLGGVDSSDNIIQIEATITA